MEVGNRDKLSMLEVDPPKILYVWVQELPGRKRKARYRRLVAFSRQDIALPSTVLGQ
jgi:hypothetical protein